MSDTLFMTGATGFIGKRLARRLIADGYTVQALCRSSGAEIPVDEPGRPPTIVEGDLLNPSGYSEALADVGTVVHLAATTGRVTRAAHFEVNVEGTRRLLQACAAAGVRRFLHVSTIAVNYPDRRRYHYAESKLAAEQLVRESRLEYAISRPTMVFGPGSPNLTALRKLAGLPIVPMFGDGNARTQPIFVDDLAALLADTIGMDRLSGQVLEFGGPDVVTVEEVVRGIRKRIRGDEGPVLHLPLGLLRPALAVAETVAHPFMPITVGQLSAFRFDSTAASNPLVERRRGTLKGLAEMLELSLA